MKQVKHSLWLVLATVLFICAGCGHPDQPEQSNVSNANMTPATSIDQGSNAADQDEQERRKALAEALAYSEKLYEQHLHHPELLTNHPPSEWPFPNYPAGDGNSLPPCVNFYSMNDSYPEYLLCEYEIEEKHYERSNEPGWFKASLGQIRQSGLLKFPQIKWIAVIVVNRAGWNGESTFEQAHKVGAIFKASDVFNPSCELSQLVALANMDHHPFMYDTSQPTPGEKQRWLIVEQHAATNNASLLLLQSESSGRH
jgi:hypothetical protein